MSSLNLIVFGATGTTGRLIVERALWMGHRVTAFVRTPSKVELRHERLTIVQGDATDADAVSAAMEGQDAVLSALGTGAFDKSRLRARATEVQLRAMRAQGVRRLVSMSCLGVGDSYEPLPFVLKYLIFPFYLRRALADHEEQEALIRGSELDWTIVRPPHLTDEGPRGDFVHGFADEFGDLTMTVSRTDVADFMLSQLSHESYLRDTPGLSYRGAGSS